MESGFSELVDSLRKFLIWDKRRLHCFTAILRGVFVVRTVNLAEIATALPGQTNLSSKYKRVQRFFKNFNFDMTIFMKIVFSTLPLIKQNVILSIDRTNWKLGKYNFNILFLALYYHKYAIPLAWKTIPHRGCSTQKMRVGLLKQVLKFMPANRITAFLGDREFIGEEWIQFLYKNEIPFFIRVKKEHMARRKGQSYQASIGSFFQTMGPKKPKYYAQRFEVYGCQLYLSGRLTNKGELMVIATNSYPRKSFKMYRKRWSIENLFSCLKSRGFRLEETHLTNSQRLEKLIFVLSLAFFIAIRRGSINSQKEPIKIKSHGRPEKSLFRKGLDAIRSFFIGLSPPGKELYWILWTLNQIGCFKQQNERVL